MRAMKRSMLVALIAGVVIAGCGSSTEHATVTTTTTVAATTENDASQTTAVRHRRHRHKSAGRSTHRPSAPHSYASTYPSGYRAEQLHEIISMHTLDPSLESRYANCVIGTLMRTVPYPVQQHVESAKKIGLPLDWWPQLITKCNDQIAS